MTAVLCQKVCRDYHQDWLHNQPTCVDDLPTSNIQYYKSIEAFPRRGSGRYQRKIFGKGDSDELTVGHQARLYLKKQHVVLYVTSGAERDVTVLDSKTGSVTPGYRPS